MPDRDPLALDEQVCFALAVASRAVVAAYRPVLEPMGLTHPQYLVMLALWEHDPLAVKDLSALLHLDPGTLSPLVKRLEKAGLVSRARAEHDERALAITLTSEGRALRGQALAVPGTMLERFGMTLDDLDEANQLLRRIVAAAGPLAAEAP